MKTLRFFLLVIGLLGISLTGLMANHIKTVAIPTLELNNKIDQFRPPFEQIAICRIQLKVTTSNVEHANTDADVWVKLNSKDHPYILNNKNDDRERNRTDVYDILSPRVNKIQDIEFIRLGLIGNDGWIIKKLELVVNGKSVYKKTFSSRGHTLDGDTPKYKNILTLSGTTLRNHALWKYHKFNTGIDAAPTHIPISMMKSLVESAVGNSIYNVKNVGWGKKEGKDYIEYRVVNNNTLHFNLDLEYSVTGPNPKVDVDFDLVFKCNNGVIQTEVKNMEVETSGVYIWLRSVLKELQASLVSACAKIPKVPPPASMVACKYGLDKIDQLLDFNFDYDLDNPSIPKNCDRSMKLDKAGNLILSSFDSRKPSKQPTGKVSGF